MKDIKKLLEMFEKLGKEFDTEFEDLDNEDLNDNLFGNSSDNISDFLNNHPLVDGMQTNGKMGVSDFAEPLYEVVEEDEEVVVIADVPGFEDDQISLRADENQVRIDAESTDSMRRESMSHVFSLPCEVVPEEADATLENGVLTVTLPRVETDDETQIEIS